MSVRVFNKMFAIDPLNKKRCEQIIEFVMIELQLFTIKITTEK